MTSNAREQELVAEWRRLVEEGLATLVGPIRQVVLSGVRRPEDFGRLRRHLAGFDCLAVELDDYDQAARFYNTLREKVSREALSICCCVRLGIGMICRCSRRMWTLSGALHLPVRLYGVGTEA